MVVLSRRVTYCTNLWSKGNGLMFTRKRDDFAYVFFFKSPRKIAVTMMFVFYPIDVIFLRDGKIVEMVSNLQPFSNYLARVKSDMIIEFPVGVNKKLSVGDEIIVSRASVRKGR